MSWREHKKASKEQQFRVSRQETKHYSETNVRVSHSPRIPSRSRNVFIWSDVFAEILCFSYNWLRPLSLSTLISPPLFVCCRDCSYEWVFLLFCLFFQICLKRTEVGDIIILSLGHMSMWSAVNFEYASLIGRDPG